MNLEDMIKNRKIEEIEKLFIEQLKHDPKNIDIWLKLALTELEFPFEDPFRALEYINEIHKISLDNLDALILEAGIKKCHMYIDYELFKRLDEVKNSDNKINAIAVYLKSYYYYSYSFGDCKKKLLEESIEFYDGFVYPCEDFGYILRDEGEINKAKKMFKKALSNVKNVAGDRDFTSLDEFIGEFITGIYLSDTNYNHIKN